MTQFAVTRHRTNVRKIKSASGDQPKYYAKNKQCPYSMLHHTNQLMAIAHRVCVRLTRSCVESECANASSAMSDIDLYEAHCGAMLCRQ